MKKLLITALTVATATVGLAKMDFSNVKLPSDAKTPPPAVKPAKTAPATRPAHDSCTVTALGFPSYENVKGTRDYSQWKTPFFLTLNEPGAPSYAPRTVFKRGQLPVMRYIAANFGQQPEKLTQVKYRIFDATGKALTDTVAGFGNPETFAPGKVKDFHASIASMREWQLGRYVIEATLQPQMRPLNANLCRRWTQPFTIIDESGSVPEDGMPFFTLYDRVRTGIPVACCLVPDGYVIGGSVDWNGETPRFHMTAYDATSYTRLTLSSPRPAKLRRIDSGIAGYDELTGELADDFQNEFLARYGFTERDARSVIAEEPQDLAAEQFELNRKVAKRHGRNLTADKSGKVRATYYTNLGNTAFAVYGEIHYELREYDGKSTELIVAALSSFCTLRNSEREEACKEALADFARSYNVCPLFYANAKPPRRLGIA